MPELNPPSAADDERSDDERSVDDLVGALLTASRVLVGVSARSLAEVEETVSVSQFRTLVVLAGHGDTRLNDLASRLAVGASTALRAVDRLVAAGLVHRRENPANRREVVISLTERGGAVVDEVTGRRRTAIAAIVQQMPRELAPRLVEALTAFAAAADEPSAEADAATRLGW